MFQDKHKGHYNDPVDQADLDHFNTWIVLNIHYFLKLLVTFLHLRTRLLNMKVNAIEDWSLFNDKIGDIAEQIRQTVHLPYNALNLLFL